MSLKAADVDRMWGKLGYEIDDKRDHVKAYLYVDGKLIAWTKRSHGKPKIEGPVIHMIRKQMQLNRRQFEDAIMCPLTRDMYHEILREQGYLK